MQKNMQSDKKEKLVNKSTNAAVKTFLKFIFHHETKIIFTQKTKSKNWQIKQLMAQLEIFEINFNVTAKK